MTQTTPKRDLQGLANLILGISFPFFYLLHWNGLLSFTWYIPLGWVGMQDSGILQMLASLVSAVIIYAGLFLLAQILIGIVKSFTDL